MTDLLHDLVLYDGECALCNRAVQFILKYDPGKRFLFAPLNGTTDARISELSGIELKSKNSLILVEEYDSADPKIYWWSQAVFRIGSRLSGAAQLPALLRYLPAWMFDWLYWLVARHRKRLFSMSECLVLSEEERRRFLP